VEDLLRKMREYSTPRYIPILREAELRLFQRVVAAVRPRRVLEIGTAIGYSALQMAPLLQDDGKIVTIEVDASRVAMARRFISQSQYDKVITILQGDAAEIIPQLRGPWDMIFMDGPKGQYSRYLSLLIPELAPQATIIADNVLFFGMVRQAGFIPHKHRTIVMRLREYIKAVTDNPHFDTVIYEEGDGMAVSHWKG